MQVLLLLIVSLIGRELSPSTTPAEIELSDACLADVNALRAAHGAPPVAWDPGLASFAQSWADRIALKGALDHSTSRYGENIAAVSAGAAQGQAQAQAQAQAAIALWYSEGSAYDASNPYGSLHFTQLVWVATERIGAGVAYGGRGSGTAFVVMEFDPPGNFEGQFGANVLPLTPAVPTPLFRPPVRTPEVPPAPHMTLLPPSMLVPKPGSGSPYYYYSGNYSSPWIKPFAVPPPAHKGAHTSSVHTAAIGFSIMIFFAVP